VQPTAIGPYTVVRLLGQGGMGAVYEVSHPEFPRPLALKVLKNDVTAVALARFGREAELLGKIRHPNVVAVHTLGRTSTGDPYLVTDLVQGQELSQLNKLRRLEPRRCAELVRDLAAALEVVHAAGVIHRDLKPANVIVTAEGIPVVLDFGVARGVGVETLTQTGTVVGTVTYMSPEQAEATGPVDARTDVYSLGAILFFLLTGLPPYQGSGVAVLTALVRPDQRLPDPREHDAEIPAALAELCRRAIARSPQDRTPTAAALGAELQDWLARDQKPAPPQRGRLLAAGLGLLALGLGLGGLGAWALPQPSTPTATPTPASTTPSRPPSTSSPVNLVPDAASAELDRLERIWKHACERPQERGPEPTDRPSPDPTFPEDTLLVELEAWLAAHSEHPQADRARELSRAARRQLPIRILNHGPTASSPTSSFHFYRVQDRQVLLASTWQRPELMRWETETWTSLGAVPLRRRGERPYHDLPEACLILPPRQGQGRRVLLGGRFGLPVMGPLRAIERGALYEITLESEALRRIPLPANARKVLSLAHNPSGRIAVGTGRREREGVVTDPGSVHLLDPQGAVLRSWELGGSVAKLAFLEGELLVACLLSPDEGPSALVRFRAQGTEVERLPLPLRASGLHVTKGQLLLGGGGGELLALSLRGTWTLPTALRREGAGVEAAPLNAFAERGQVVFAGYGGSEPLTPPGTRELVLWRRSGSALVQARRLPRPTPILALALSPEGRYLVTRGRRNRIEVWDAQALAED
jgi:serine/threonine protein kinase